MFSFFPSFWQQVEPEVQLYTKSLLLLEFSLLRACFCFYKNVTQGLSRCWVLCQNVAYAVHSRPILGRGNCTNCFVYL